MGVCEDRTVSVKGARLLGESWRQWKEGTGLHVDAVLRQLLIRQMDWDGESVLS